MNLLTRFLKPVRSKSGRDKGFALIAVITLMLLLSLLAVALMSMASSVSRMSEKGRWSEEARSQARLALEIAIGRLQCELGPDQRISASSGIFSNTADDQSTRGVGSGHILGVWNSWDNYLNRNNSRGRGIGNTYNTGRSDHFRRWLISAADDRTVQNWRSVVGDSGLGTGNARDKRRVLLLGKGTLGDSDRSGSIYAGLVEMDGSSSSTSTGSGLTQRNFRGLRAVEPQRRQTASRPRDAMASGSRNYIAWWISGENLKARINLPDYSQESNSDIDILRRQWDTPPPDVSIIPGLEGVANSLKTTGSEGEAMAEKLFSWGNVEMLSTGRKAGIAPAFHIASLSSSGLLTDVKFGGLKKDLNMLLSSNDILGTDYGEMNGQSDVSIRPYSSGDTNQQISNSSRPLASWKQLYYWYNMWKGSTYNGQDTTAPLIWQNGQPSTFIAADPGEGVMNNRYTYMRQPVLLKMYVFLGLVWLFHDTYVPFDGLDGQYGARPVYVWWNPYNVPMEIGRTGQVMGGFSAAYRIYPAQHSTKCDSDRYDDTGNGRTFKFPWLLYSESNFAYGTGSDTTLRGWRDQGNSFRKSYQDKTIVFAPGEIKVFGHDLSYDQQNNSENVLNRNLASKADANHFIHKFEGHEVTYLQKNEYAPTHVVPVLFKYTNGVSKESGDPTVGRFICLGWMWRTDIVETYLDFRLPAGLDGLYSSEMGQQSVYQLFLKKNGSDKEINFAVGAGLMDERSSAMSTGDLDYGKALSRLFPSFININWIEEKPYSFITGGQGLRIADSLFNIMWNGDAMPARLNGTWGEPNNDGNPFWVGYYGIAPKTVSGPADLNASYKGEDARNKTWQHSSPIYFGSQMPNPTALLRKHHPYQFELKQRTANDYTQLDIISGDVIGQIIANSESGAGDENGGCYFGYRDEDMVSTIVAAELPIHPPFSLAGFATARLLPGWYDESMVMGEGELSAKRARRLSYQSGVSGVGIGNSLADPMIPADQVHYNYNVHDPELADFWDHTFLINDALWDTWYTSSISDRPTTIGGNVTSYQDVIGNFVNNHFSNQNDSSKMLSNSRFKLNPGMESANSIINELTGNAKRWEKSSKYLTLEGAFNVNSTSVDAWAAVLNALKSRGILYADKTTGVPRLLSESQNERNVFFKRFTIASSDRSRYDEPLLKIQGENNTYYWSDLRELQAASSPQDSSDIYELARQIVVQIKTRGPFLNMAEFINRRLVAGLDSDLSNKGALQAAIDNSGLNRNFNTTSLHIDEYAEYPNPSASSGSMQTASPGYLVQSDILASLGNTLTVRDDTFTIRAYGQVSDPSGTQIRGRAWCEAVVQRTVDYVDPSDDPETPVYEVDLGNGDVKNTSLSSLNKAFGRRFTIVSFRWLSPEEV